MGAKFVNPIKIAWPIRKSAIEFFLLPSTCAEGGSRGRINIVGAARIVGTNDG
jgi:hypothetical protein